MNKIPEEHYVKPFQQQTYLINGELRTWNGDFTNIYSTISSTEQYAPTVFPISARSKLSKPYNQPAMPITKVKDYGLQ